MSNIYGAVQCFIIRETFKLFYFRVNLNELWFNGAIINLFVL